MEILKEKETKDLMLRVYNNKMIEDKEKKISDEEDIKALCKKVFNDGSVTPDPSLLHQFNNIVVKVADEIARPSATSILKLLSDYQTTSVDNIFAYTIPPKFKSALKWSASGTGVDLTRVEGGQETIAVPKDLQTGFYYEPLSLVKNPVENFRKLVNDIAEAKTRLYLEAVTKIFREAVATGKIPANNIKTGTGLNLSDFNKIASVIQRVGNGGRPIFVADSLLIDHFASFLTSDPSKSALLTDDVKKELLSALNITQIGKVTCVNLVNQFIDEKNTKVELPVNEGYFFSGTAKNKPLVVVEYGGLRQFTEQDPEDERIKIMLKQKAAVELVVAQNVGYIKDDGVTL